MSVTKSVYFPDGLNDELDELLDNNPELKVKFNLSSICQEAVRKYIDENQALKIRMVI